MIVIQIGKTGPGSESITIATRTEISNVCDVVRTLMFIIVRRTCVNVVNLCLIQCHRFIQQRWRQTHINGFIHASNSCTDMYGYDGTATRLALFLEVRDIQIPTTKMYELHLIQTMGPQLFHKLTLPNWMV